MARIRWHHGPLKAVLKQVFHHHRPDAAGPIRSADDGDGGGMEKCIQVPNAHGSSSGEIFRLFSSDIEITIIAGELAFFPCPDMAWEICAERIGNTVSREISFDI
jgi:hypothetical protein